MPCLFFSRIASTAAAALPVGGLVIGLDVGKRVVGLLVPADLVVLVVVILVLLVVVVVAPVAAVVDDLAVDELVVSIVPLWLEG